MKVVFSEAQRQHYPSQFLVNGRLQPNPEVPGRIDALLGAVEQRGDSVVAPPDYGLAPVAAVHTAEYLSFMAHIHTRWGRIEGASDEVIPNVHPRGESAGYPRSAVGQAGYHMTDTACPISEHTWDSALASSHTATHGAHLILAGEHAVYALCRPPGHHAFGDLAGGFCYFNNCAIAAERLRASAKRVAILDVDVHHGNGTQGIFYRRADVLTVSLHADPIRFYPFFWGHRNERGEGPGLGYNLNLPLARGSDDDTYLAALPEALARIRSFCADVLVVALGLDAFAGDPLAGLGVTTAGFGRIAAAVAGLELPTLLVQEGGYLCPALGENLASFLAAFDDP